MISSLKTGIEIVENQTSIQEVRTGVRRHRECAKGKIVMSNDSDQPLEDFAEHME